MITWLNDRRFDHIAVGALVMFTENASILKGAVNGATNNVIILYKQIIFYFN